MHRIVKIINKLYTKHLFVTNTVTCSVLLGVGDSVVQYIDKRKSRNFVSEKPQEVNVGTEINSKLVPDVRNVEKETELKTHTDFDWSRTKRMCAVGLVMGPLNHFFYLLLDKYLVGRGVKIIFKKIVLDQVIAAPMFNTAFIFGSCYLEKKTMETAAKEWIEKFPVIYVGDWVYWPPVQVINFYFFPSRYRVLFVANATLVWNVYISFVKHHDVKINMGSEKNATVEGDRSKGPYETNSVALT